MSADTGGPAFPCHDICHDDFPGMTLRDYFAAHAPKPDDTELKAMWDKHFVYSPYDKFLALAMWNYNYATAMLAERAK